MEETRLESSDDDAHVQRYRLWRASLAATVLESHMRLCPACILRGPRRCELGAVLVPIIEEAS